MSHRNVCIFWEIQVVLKMGDHMFFFGTTSCLILVHFQAPRLTNDQNNKSWCWMIFPTIPFCFPIFGWNYSLGNTCPPFLLRPRRFKSVLSAAVKASETVDTLRTALRSGCFWWFQISSTHFVVVVVGVYIYRYIYILFTLYMWKWHVCIYTVYKYIYIYYIVQYIYICIHIHNTVGVYVYIYNEIVWMVTTPGVWCFEVITTLVMNSSFGPI